MLLVEQCICVEDYNTYYKFVLLMLFVQNFDHVALRTRNPHLYIAWTLNNQHHKGI